MNIYLSSSWKNRVRVRALAIALRSEGHEVYDFTDPNSRKMPEIPPEKYPDLFDPVKHVEIPDNSIGMSKARGR